MKRMGDERQDLTPDLFGSVDINDSDSEKRIAGLLRILEGLLNTTAPEPRP